MNSDEVIQEYIYITMRGSYLPSEYLIPVYKEISYQLKNDLSEPDPVFVLVYRFIDKVNEDTGRYKFIGARP